MPRPPLAEAAGWAKAGCRARVKGRGVLGQEGSPALASGADKSYSGTFSRKHLLPQASTVLMVWPQGPSILRKHAFLSKLSYSQYLSKPHFRSRPIRAGQRMRPRAFRVSGGFPESFWVCIRWMGKGQMTLRGGGPGGGVFLSSLNVHMYHCLFPPSSPSLKKKKKN